MNLFTACVACEDVRPGLWDLDERCYRCNAEATLVGGTANSIILAGVDADAIPGENDE